MFIIFKLYNCLTKNTHYFYKTKWPDRAWLGGVYFWTFSLVATMHNRKYVVTELVVNSSSSEESQGRTESGADCVTDMLLLNVDPHPSNEVSRFP